MLLADIQEILRVPEHEIISVTQALTGLELEKIDPQQWGGRHIVADVIHTIGFFESSIVCEMEQTLFRYILTAMYGNGMPPVEQQALYINEYMNIVFGRMVSTVNDMTGRASRLSPPEYLGRRPVICDPSEERDRITLVYRTGEGKIRFMIQFNSNRMEEVEHEYDNYGS